MKQLNTNKMEAQKTVDVTPKWSDIVVQYLRMYTDLNSKGKAELEKEFKRMAKAADAYNELLKSDTLNEPK